MGDNRRFNLFAELISKQLPPNLYKNIADVAGGKGYLQFALKQKGYKNIITFDKRKKEKRVNVNNLNYSYRFFSSNIKEDFDLLVGMHPDESTDLIIVEAIKRSIPFIICPCCVKPYAVIFNKQHNYTNWIEHLKNIATKANYDVQEFALKMTGKNIVLMGKNKLRKTK